MILGSGLLQSGIPSFGTVAADSSDSSLFSGYTPNVAAVGPVSRRLYFGKSGGTWKTLWTDTTGALLRGDGAGTHAVTLASDGPEPFDTDDGLATDTHSGSVAAGTTFVHEADFVLEYEVTTASGAETMVVFRRSDASNYWAIQINTSGVRLVKYEGGSGYSIALAGSNTDSRIVVVAEDTTIRVFQDNILLYTYTSATLNSSATSGFVRNPIIGAGAISDLKTWPRTLSGTAASILDKASA